jgi:hypothetical protein
VESFKRRLVSFISDCPDKIILSGV